MTKKRTYEQISTGHQNPYSVNPRTSGRRNRGHRRGEKTWVTEQASGRTVTLFKHKRTPKGCKAPRQVCIKCLTESCDKRAHWYTSKVCPACTSLIPGG